MLSRKFFALLLICLLAFTATGCRLFGPGGDEGSTTTTTTIKTLIKKPAAGSLNMLGNLRAGIRPQITEEPVTDATVTLRLSDGRVITMTDNGNGEYTATVSGLEGASGFVIEARKGDLLVQNMVTDLKNTDLTAPITSNHLTTAFVQVAMAAAKVLATSTGIQVATLDDLIKQVTSIEIEFNELKKQVTDEDNATYELSRKFVAIGLAEADLNAEGGKSLLEKIIDGDVDATTISQQQDLTTWNEQITKAIEDGDISLPTVAPEEDKDKINAAMDIFMNAFLKMVSGTSLTTAETTALSGVLDEDFVLRGMTKSKILLAMPEEDGDLDRFDGEHVLSKVDDNMYLVHVRGTAYMKSGATTAIDSTLDGYSYNPKDPQKYTARTLWTKVGEFPVMVRKQTDGSWKIYGNRTKVDEADIDLQFVFDMNNKTKRTQMHLEVRETESFPIKSVTIRGGQIGATEVALKKDPNQTDSNAWKYFFNDGTNEWQSPYPPHTNQWAYPTVAHKAGDEYTFKITFEDNSIQEYAHKVPTIPSGYAPFNDGNVVVSTDESKLTITWPRNNFPGFDNYYLSVWDQSDNNRVLESEISAVNTTTAEFVFQSTSYQLTPGKQYSMNLHSNLETGLNQHAHYFFTIPDQIDNTVTQASALAKALDNGLKVVANGAGNIPVITPASPPPPSMRLSGTAATNLIPPFPAGTEFFTNYMAYTAAGTLSQVFSMPAALGSGIEHLLIRFKDASGNPMNYNNGGPSWGMTGEPEKMDMLVVYNSVQNSTNIAMELGMEDHPIVSDPDGTLSFEGIGTVTTQLSDGTNLEIRITDSTFDKRSSGSGGLNMRAELFVNDEPFKIDGKIATIVDGAYMSHGLYDAKIMLAGETQPAATLERVGGKLYLKIPGQDDIDLGE